MYGVEQRGVCHYKLVAYPVFFCIYPNVGREGLRKRGYIYTETTNSNDVTIGILIQVGLSVLEYDCSPH